MKVSVDVNRLAYIQASTDFSVQQIRLSDNYTYLMTMTNKGMERVFDKIPGIFRAIDLSSNKFK